MLAVWKQLEAQLLPFVWQIMPFWKHTALDSAFCTNLVQSKKLDVRIFISMDTMDYRLDTSFVWFYWIFFKEILPYIKDFAQIWMNEKTSFFKNIASNWAFYKNLDQSKC